MLLSTVWKIKPQPMKISRWLPIEKKKKKKSRWLGFILESFSRVGFRVCVFASESVRNLLYSIRGDPYFGSIWIHLVGFHGKP